MEKHLGFVGGVSMQPSTPQNLVSWLLSASFFMDHMSCLYDMQTHKVCLFYFFFFLYFLPRAQFGRFVFLQLWNITSVKLVANFRDEPQFWTLNSAHRHICRSTKGGGATLKFVLVESQNSMLGDGWIQGAHQCWSGIVLFDTIWVSIMEISLLIKKVKKYQ